MDAQNQPGDFIDLLGITGHTLKLAGLGVEHH
jgi:hypothetical protein